MNSQNEISCVSLISCVMIYDDWKKKSSCACQKMASS